MATPAPPVLASDMYTPELTDLFSDNGAESPAKQQKLSTGVKAIDQSLEGGFEFGAIHCITSEPDQDTKEALQTLLISHLCSASHATATVIDSALSFDLLGLYHALESHLKELSAANQEAKTVLERLKIMKVFDCTGLAEALSEVRESLEKDPAETEEPKKVPKSTIEDSEGEEEMLDDPRPKEQIAVLQAEDTQTPQQPKPQLLIITDITKVMAPLIKNNYANGQALLASLMRSLRHVTTQHNLCPILFSNASNKPATEEEALSLFASCTIRPALGPTFGHLVDVQLYLHQIPSRKVSEAEKAGKTVEMVNILEVVQDTVGMRYGRWAPFLCTADGRLADVS